MPIFAGFLLQHSIQVKVRLILEVHDIIKNIETLKLHIENSVKFKFRCGFFGGAGGRYSFDQFGHR